MMAFGLILSVILIYAFFTFAQTKMVAFTFSVAGIMCLALGALFATIESSLTRINKYLYLPFVLLFFSFCYFNQGFQAIENKHGIDKNNPQKNSFILQMRRHATFFKQLTKTFDQKNNPIVFNVPLSVCPMFMFYTETTGYEIKPSEEDIKKIKAEGRNIFILAKEIQTNGIENNSSVQLIRYPENTEIQRENVAFRLKYSSFSDEEGVMYPDNDERAIFFAKGVVETVKKLNWVPDIIHVHGWMAAMLPVYMKYYYKDEALFANTKIVTSVYSQSFDGNLDLEMINKVAFDNIPADVISDLTIPTYENIIKASINHSDAVIIASDSLTSSLTKFIESSGKPFLPFAPKDKFAEAYTNFYKNSVL